MAQNNDFKLDLLSKIDEKMVDKVTVLRAKLTRKPRMKRKTLWTITSIAASFLLIAGVLLALLPMLLKQVPVYTGMTVSNQSPFEVAYAGDAQYELLAATGHFEGDHDGKEKKPAKNPNLQDEVRDTLKVEGAAEPLYYANPKEDIYITVHIDNPDQYEILSFTLNGEKYSSYMFEEGSNMENLVLKVNVGDVEGLVEYTIDAIKYVDGTRIKDVKMEGDQTVRVGVKPKKGVSTKIDSEKVDYNTISLIATVVDPFKMIELTGGKVELALYSKSGELVETKDIPLNSATEVIFEGLHPNTEYQYALVAHYDKLEGKGFGTYVLQQKAVVTQPGALFGSIEITQEELSFAPMWNESITNQNFTSLTLYRGEEKLLELAADATKVSDLLSGVEYRLVAEYELEGKTESIALTFTTVAKAMPEIQIANADLGQTGFAFGFADPDQIGTITKIELLKDEVVIQTLSDFSHLSFEGLESNTAYQIKVAFTYDLNDGNGTQNSEVIKDVATMPHPIEITNATFFGSSTVKYGESVILRISLSNPDQMEIKGFEINGTLVQVMMAGNDFECFYKPTVTSGKEELKITGVTFLNAANQTAMQKFDDVSEIPVLIRGDVLVEDFYVEKNLYTSNDTILATVVFKGSESYEVMSVVCKINNSYDTVKEYALTKVSETCYTFEITDLNPYNTVDRFTLELTQIKFKTGSQDLGSTEEKTNQTTFCLAIMQSYSDEQLVPISTPEELQNMQTGYGYKLVNDIDLSGVLWAPYALESVYLNGNGYKIKNLSISSTQGDTYVGLFSELQYCYFDHVILENANIILWFKTDYCGIFAARSSSTVFENCSVTGNIKCGPNALESRGAGYIGTSASSSRYNCFIECTYEGKIECGSEKASAFYSGTSKAFLIECTSCTNVPLWWNATTYSDQIVDCEELPYNP